ncbi:hypothetical protein [Rufibacter sp. LB8]|uniref:hypothetical protein n=1 Tax=Rufibacter sp. LB8 TaxID=2777781 RepID=UPI00178C751B|nr:hypothetical protein [Rufibacter sp. LB8]
MPTIPLDLKAALLSMPQTRKDKLLLQLLAPNQLLQDRLRFELLENGQEGLEARREKLQNIIQIQASGLYYSAADLLTNLRLVCPQISYHANVTKDAYGEVQLLIRLLKEVLFHQKGLLQTYSGATQAIGLFLAKRAEEMLRKLQKLPQDFHVEFEAEVNMVLPLLHASAAGYAARAAGVPTTWS